jgi:Protein of unknown function (DUF1674)
MLSLWGQNQIPGGIALFVVDDRIHSLLPGFPACDDMPERARCGAPWQAWQQIRRMPYRVMMNKERPSPETIPKPPAPEIPPPPAQPREIGGPKGPEPTRYGDWEVGGRCTDF